jgi:hypothetical protein
LFLKFVEGSYQKRASAKMFAEWVRLAGGKVQGSLREKKAQQMKSKSSQSTTELVASSFDFISKNASSNGLPNFSYLLIYRYFKKNRYLGSSFN